MKTNTFKTRLDKKGILGIKKVSSKKEAENCACGSDSLTEKIQQKAFELYQQRGCQHGFHEEDWLTAEKIVKSQQK